MTNSGKYQFASIQFLVACLLTGSLLLFDTQKVQAGTCIMPRAPLEEMERADVVFAGVAIGHEAGYVADPISNQIPMHLAPFEVSQSWQMVQPLPFATTLLLYMDRSASLTEGSVPESGLYARPVIPPFDQPTLSTNYGALANAESPFLYFFSHRPQLSPNGRYLLVPGMGAQTDPMQPAPGFIRLVDLQNGTMRQLLEDAPLVRWSPQSDHFAYVADHALYAQALVPDAPARLLFAHNELAGGFLAWSPDNQWIAATTIHTEQPTEQPTLANQAPPTVATLWLVPLNGDRAVELAKLPLAAMEHVPQELAWSHDGRHLVFMGTIINLDGSQFRPAGIGLVNEWLPDRSLLLAVQGPSLVLLTPQGDRTVVIAAKAGHMLARAFSHDGQKLAYVDSAEDGQQVVSIYDFDAKTGHPLTQLPRDFGSIGYLAWSAHDDYLLLDNLDMDSPIWAVPAKSDSPLVEVAEQGMLVQVAAQKPVRPSVAQTQEPSAKTTHLLGQRAPHRFDTITQTLAAPNEKWVAEVLVQTPNQDQASPEYYQQLAIHAMDGSQRFDPIKLWSPFGLGYDYPLLLQWSAESKSVYFAQGGPGDGCGVFSGPVGLNRFDLETGTTTRLLIGGRWATLSPAEDQVAYLQPDGLYIHTLYAPGMQVAERPLGWPAPAGHPVWSPDGSQVAYTIAHNACDGGWAQSTSVVLVDGVVLADGASMAQRELLTEDSRRLITQSWLDEMHLLLVNPENDAKFSLDIESGNMEELTQE